MAVLVVVVVVVPVASPGVWVDEGVLVWVVIAVAVGDTAVLVLVVVAIGLDPAVDVERGIRVAVPVGLPGPALGTLVGVIAPHSPLYCSIRARLLSPSLERPTAHTLFGPTAATSFRVLNTRGPLRTRLSLQAAPSQCKARVRLGAVGPSRVSPTAHTSFGPSASKPKRLRSHWSLVGLGTVLHPVPSQCRVRVFLKEPL